MQEPATTSQQIAAPARSQPVPDCKLFWTRLVADDSGQDLIEYALLAALIGLGSVLSMKGLSNKIANTFNSVGSTLTNDV
jgi:pilus assembly protein Flp/PilA